MPALPWTTIRTPDPARSYLAYATKLPLAKHRFVPGFLRDTLRIRRQLRSASGLVGYALLADLRHATFWTVSVWEDEAALRAFAGAEPHRSITRRLPGRMGASVLRSFDVAGIDVQVPWPDVKTRLS